MVQEVRLHASLHDVGSGSHVDAHGRVGSGRYAANSRAGQRPRAYPPDGMVRHKSLIARTCLEMQCGVGVWCCRNMHCSCTIEQLCEALIRRSHLAFRIPGARGIFSVAM